MSISLVNVNTKKEENRKFVSYTIFVLKQVSHVLQDRIMGGFDASFKGRLVNIVMQYGQCMWDTYHCCDSITQVLTHVYSSIPKEVDGGNNLITDNHT